MLQSKHRSLRIGKLLSFPAQVPWHRRSGLSTVRNGQRAGSLNAGIVCRYRKSDCAAALTRRSGDERDPGDTAHGYPRSAGIYVDVDYAAAPRRRS